MLQKLKSLFKIAAFQPDVFSSAALFLEGSALNSFSILMWLAHHEKSYLTCEEITNFQIFTKPIPIFFQSTKLRQPKQGRDS